MCERWKLRYVRLPLQAYLAVIDVWPETLKAENDALRRRKGDILDGEPVGQTSHQASPVVFSPVDTVLSSTYEAQLPNISVNRSGLFQKPFDGARVDLAEMLSVDDQSKL